jgi:hypothetical protein
MCSLWNVRFSQCCCWRYRSFGTWCCVPGQVVPDVSEGHIAFIVRVKLFDPEGSGTTVLYETSGTTCPRSQHHVPGDVCYHVFHCYRQTHGLSNVCCYTRGERWVDQMCEVSEFVVGNVVAGFECLWSQQNIPWAVLYCTVRSQNLWTAGSEVWR